MGITHFPLRGFRMRLDEAPVQIVVYGELYGPRSKHHDPLWSVCLRVSHMISGQICRPSSPRVRTVAIFGGPSPWYHM